MESIHIDLSNYQQSFTHWVVCGGYQWTKKNPKTTQKPFMCILWDLNTLRSLIHQRRNYQWAHMMAWLMWHTPGENIGPMILLFHQFSYMQHLPTCYHTLSAVLCVFLLVLKVYWMFVGLFFHRILSKHRRCLVLCFLSGCEVFVTVATPTPSVMAWQEYENTLVCTLVRWGHGWMLTELFMPCRLLSPHTGEVSSVTAW